MAAKIRKAARATQHVLQLAACIGYSFDLRTLAAIAEQTLVDTLRQLWSALEEGVLLPVGEQCQFLAVSGDDPLGCGR